MRGALTVGQDDGLVLYFNLVAVLARKHVHLALVHPQLANVGLGEEKGVRGRRGGGGAR